MTDRSTWYIQTWGVVLNLLNCSPLTLLSHMWQSVMKLWVSILEDPSDICLTSPLDHCIDKHLTHYAHLLLFMPETDGKAVDIFTVYGEEWRFLSLKIYCWPFIWRRLECSRLVKSANDKHNLSVFHLWFLLRLINKCNIVLTYFSLCLWNQLATLRFYFQSQSFMDQ